MRNFLLLISIFLVSNQLQADEIQWRTIQEVEQLMKDEPRKVIVDFYTSWCGWCKVMDKKTYSNDSLIQYVNDNFYAIKFDAESKDSFDFMGKSYKFNPQYRANEWAVEVLNGRMSYPTTVFMMEGFKTPMALPGYQELGSMEVVLHYIQSESFKEQNFDEYNSEYQRNWSE